MLIGGNVRIAQGGVITKELAREGGRIHLEMTMAQDGGMLNKKIPRAMPQSRGHTASKLASSNLECTQIVENMLTLTCVQRNRAASPKRDNVKRCNYNLHIFQVMSPRESSCFNSQNKSTLTPKPSTCVYTYIHTYIHTNIHTYKHTYNMIY